MAQQSSVLPQSAPRQSGLAEKDNMTLKRLRGKLSCAECRRSKLKCDKNIPCDSCTRRGCADFCPTGEFLPTGRGNRAVPTKASRLQKALGDMTERARILEEEVTRLNESPLSTCPYLASGKTTQAEEEDHNDEILSEIQTIMGDLSLKRDATENYFGPTGVSEAMLSLGHKKRSPSPDPNGQHRPPGVDILIRTAANPIVSLTYLLNFLPSFSRAEHLVKTYFDNGCWSGTPIDREELAELLLLAYGDASKSASSGIAPPGAKMSIHHLSVLFGVFALASLVDLALPADSFDANLYFDLSCAALGINSQTIFDESALEAGYVTIQGLVLTSLFYWHGGKKFSLEAAWTAIMLAGNTCLRLKFHTAQEACTNLETLRYRSLFWQTFAIGSYQCMALGRPNFIFLDTIKCPLPDIPDTVFIRRLWQFSKQIGAPTLETMLRVSSGTSRYEDILDLDERVRRFLESPFCTTPIALEGSAQDTPTGAFQQRGMRDSCLSTLLYIHSRPFIRAVRQNPDAPWETSFSTSFLSAYRYAGDLIREHGHHFAAHPLLYGRWWPVWNCMFNAGVIVGTVAAKSFKSAYGPQALLQLLAAIDLFERGTSASESPRVKSGLEMLQKLRDKAMKGYVDNTGLQRNAATNLPVFTDETRVLPVPSERLDQMEVDWDDFIKEL